MLKKFYFILLLFFTSAAFAQKTFIQCGKLIDGISNKEQTEVTIVVEGKLITEIQMLRTEVDILQARMRVFEIQLKELQQGADQKAS